jgi:hypothetical protein
MPLSIGELTTDVIAEGASPEASSAPASTDAAKDPQSVRAELSAVARDLMRTRAEGFDD